MTCSSTPVLYKVRVSVLTWPLTMPTGGSKDGERGKRAQEAGVQMFWSDPAWTTHLWFDVSLDHANRRQQGRRERKKSAGGRCANVEKWWLYTSHVFGCMLTSNCLFKPCKYLLVLNVINNSTVKPHNHWTTCPIIISTDYYWAQVCCYCCC